MKVKTLTFSVFALFFTNQAFAQQATEAFIRIIR